MPHVARRALLASAQDVRLRTAGVPPVRVESAAVRHVTSSTIGTPDPELQAWIQAQVLRVSSSLYHIGKHASSVIKGIKCALACLGICSDFMAEAPGKGSIIAIGKKGSQFFGKRGYNVVHTVHLARVNAQRGFEIMETFENLEPSDTKEVCDLIANPDQHTQFTPRF